MTADSAAQLIGRITRLVPDPGGRAPAAGCADIAMTDLPAELESRIMRPRGDPPMRTLCVLTVLVTMAGSVPAAAQSQITTGVIDGTVVDSSGGVLPGVDVEVRNVETNFTRSL